MEHSKCGIELDTKRVGSHLQTSMNTQWILYVNRGKTQALAHAHMTCSEALSGVEPGNLCFLNSVCSHVRCSLCSRMHRPPPRSCRIGWQTYQERNRLVELKELKKWESYTHQKWCCPLSDGLFAFRVDRSMGKALSTVYMLTTYVNQ